MVKKILVEDSDATHTNGFFIPNLYSSQPCESTFRQARSLTSTFSTVINFNILDIINRIEKIQLQSDIINSSKNEIKFPRFQKKAASKSNRLDCHRMEGLNSDTIIALIENAKETVTSELNDLEIDTSKLDFHCQISPVSEDDLTDIQNNSSDDLYDEWDSDSDEIESRTETLVSDYTDSEPEEEIQEDINSLSGISYCV